MAAQWHLIETDFGGDETTVFGPRKETGTALYQVETLASILPSELGEVKTLPNVVSTVLGSFACISVDKLLAVFNDCRFTDTFMFDSVVDALEWSPDGKFLIVGCSDGCLYVLDSIKLELIFSRSVVAEDNIGKGHAFKRIMFNSREEGLLDLICLTANGQLFVMRNLNLKTSLDISGDMAKSIFSHVKIITVDTSKQHTVKTSDIVFIDNKIITLGSGDLIIAVWSLTGSKLELHDGVSGILNDGAGAVSGKAIPDSGCLFILDENNCLTVWSCLTLTLVQQWSHLTVSSFQILDSNDTNSSQVDCLRVVMLIESENEQFTVQVLSFPSCQTVYSLQLNSSAMITQCLPIQEVVYIAEYYSDQSSSQPVSAIRFKCLLETEPETRLYRLIRKKKFQEAKEFARTYNLDIEMVYKAQLNIILDQLSPWNVGELEKEVCDQLISEMWDAIGLITDDLHLADTCIRAALPTYFDTLKLQNWCHSMLQNVGKRKNGHQIQKYQELMTKFYTIQNRFCTYRMAYGSDNYSAAEWDLFMRANLMKEVCRALKDGHMDVAFVLCRRHQEEWTKHMTVEMIENILSSIPDHLTTTNLYGWIKDDLIPYVRRIVPLALTNVLNWSINKAINMEKFEKKDWPQNALKFLKSVDTCICEETEIAVTDSANTLNDRVAKSTVTISAAMTRLHDTLSCLKKLCDLKYKYKHNLTLKQFQEETVETLVFRMLDKVSALELLNQTLKKQIQPYIREHNLNENEIFSRYAADLLGRKIHVKSYSGASLWEAKLVAVIGYIKDPKEKVSAIIDIVRLSPLPISFEIENLIKSCLEIKHPLVSKLKEHVRRLEVRKLIFSYPLRNKFVPSQQNAKNLMFYILTQDTKTCLSDAFKVMEAYDLKLHEEIYAFRARYLISHNRIQEYLEMLKKIPQQIIVQCGKKMIYSQPEVHQPVHERTQEPLVLKKRFIYAAVETGRILDSFVQDILQREELRSDCRDLKRVLSLQNEYGIFLTLNEYRNEKSRECLLLNYVKRTFSRPQSEIDFGKLCRLADLLQVSHIQFLSELATFAARTGHIATAVKYSRKILDFGVSERSVLALCDVGMCFLQVLANVETIEPEERCHVDDLVSAAHELACESTVHSKGCDILRCLEVYKAASLALSVSQQCENGYGDRGQRNTLEPLFQEDALVMTTEDAIPMVANYLILHPSFISESFEGKKEEEDEEEGKCELTDFSLQSKNVINYLMNNSHMELAFQFLAHTISSAAVFVSQHFMGYNGNPEIETKFGCLKKCLSDLVEGAKPWEEKLISELFIKSLNCSRVDHRYALLCISSLPLKQAKRILLTTVNSSTKDHNYKKLKAVSTIGIALGQIHKVPDMICSCRDLQSQAKWGYRLRNLKIDFGHVLRCGQALKILAQIAPYDTVDINVVKEFCQDFNFEEVDGLMIYLEQVVSHGCKHSKVRAVIREINDTDCLLSKLNQLLRECSPYDYEKIGFLLGEIQQFTDTPLVQKGINILEYIKIYTRRSPPSAYEKKYFEDENKNKNDLSLNFSCAVNESKLPYHLLVYGDPWEIISPELHIDSLQIWISLADKLEIKEDNIYTGAVRNMVAEYVKSHQKTQTDSDKRNHSNWNLTSSSIDFLQDIKELILRVSCVPMALACTQFVIRELPTGAEKIQALKEGTALAEKWYLLCEEKSGEKDQAWKAFVKFSSVLKQLSTQRVLYLHNMDQPEFLSLDRSPKELILKLFEQPAIIEQGWSSEACDAYEIAEEIAKINDLNLQDFISSLVDKWLPSGESVDEGDNTMTFDLSKMNNTEPSTLSDDDNLKRVLYIMRKGSLETNVIYMLNIIFPEEKDVVRNCSLLQLRALHCLLRLCDNDSLMKICNKTTENLRHLALVMGYLVELEKLHFVYSMEKFEQCNKESLVKGIWRNHSHKKNAVLLVASLCLDYDINIPSFWEQLLKQFLTLGLLDYLEVLLIRLCSIPATWIVPSFHKAWQAFISSALNKYCAPLSEHQQEMCVHYFSVLLRCPVLSSLDMRSLADQYKSLELDVCSAGCLLLLEDNNVKEYLDGDKLLYLQQLDSLTHMGFNGAIAQQIQGEIFDLIDEEQKYSVILGSQYMERFVHRAIKCDKINKLLEFAIKHKKVKVAETLVKSYCSYYTYFGEELEKYMQNQKCSSYLEAYFCLKEDC